LFLPEFCYAHGIALHVSPPVLPRESIQSLPNLVDADSKPIPLCLNWCIAPVSHPRVLDVCRSADALPSSVHVALPGADARDIDVQRKFGLESVSATAVDKCEACVVECSGGQGFYADAEGNGVSNCDPLVLVPRSTAGVDHFESAAVVGNCGTSACVCRSADALPVPLHVALPGTNACDIDVQRKFDLEFVSAAALDNCDASVVESICGQGSFVAAEGNSELNWCIPPADLHRVPLVARLVVIVLLLPRVMVLNMRIPKLLLSPRVSLCLQGLLLVLLFPVPPKYPPSEWIDILTLQMLCQVPCMLLFQALMFVTSM
jgi:hypothetical protein